METININKDVLQKKITEITPQIECIEKSTKVLAGLSLEGEGELFELLLENKKKFESSLQTQLIPFLQKVQVNLQTIHDDFENQEAEITKNIKK